MSERRTTNSRTIDPARRADHRLPFAALLAVVAALVAAPAFGQVCPDADADTFADCTVAGCDATGLTCGDCDDGAAAVNPGATESCNRVDDDCDGITDEGFAWPTAAESVFDPGALPTGNAGESLAHVGDVDGDGLSDFAVGAPVFDGAANNAGAVALFSGADRSLLCRMTDPDASSSDQLGTSIAGIGDVTGDGVPDVAAGVPLDDEGASNTGSVVVFSGADCSFVRRIVAAGAVANDQLGVAVAGIDDVDGDGVPDIVAGAPERDVAAVSDAGIVYVFSGADGTQIHAIGDPAGLADDNLGSSVASIGDVDSDGVADILAGAVRDDTAAVNAGAVLVASGATGAVLYKSLAPVPTASDELGRSVVGLGDVDGDSVPDFAAGAPGVDLAASNAGAILVFSGIDGSFIREIVDPAAATGDGLGASVAAVADLTGDGIDEILAGADGDDANGTSAGTALLFSAADGTLVRELVDPDGAASNAAGSAVAAVPDLSGDGNPDLLVGAPGADGDEENGLGKVVVFSLEADCDGDGASPFVGDCDDGDASAYPGNPDVCDGVDNDCDGQVDDDDDFDGFGICDDCDPADPLVFPGAEERCNGADDDCDTEVDEGSDLDGDGSETPCDCDDTDDTRFPGAVESCDRIDNDCDGAVDEASAAVLAAESVFDPQARPDDGAGESVAAVGDVDGDGVSDFAVGEPLYDDVATNEGSVAVYSGADRSLICRATDPSASSSNQLGSSVAGIGDVSGDGVPDLAAGARLSDEVASNDGVVLLFSGADCTLLERLAAADGSNNDYLGVSVAGLGDVTGDGIADIAAGAPLYDGPAGNDQGSVVIFSGADGSVVERVVMPNGRSGDEFGTTVAALGDIDGDGIAEILVGAPDDSLLSGSAGSVSVVSGGGRSYIRKLVDPLGGSGDDFGAAVAGLADVDGDGFPDIAVGAPGEDDVAANSGVVVILSGADGSTIRRLKDPSASSSDGLGTSVAGVADIDGDGVPEIVAGAPLDDAGGTNAGTALLFSGADGSLLYELFDPAAVAGDGAGTAVAVVADLSGDGVADVIVGAPDADGDEDSGVGKAIVFSIEADCDGDGESPFGGDCDDGDPDNFTGNVEICDMQDNDCDTTVDEDDDFDGFGICDDCDPADPRVFPGAEERCNGVDDDCDTIVDEGSDLDGDGSQTPCDCDDADDTRFPGAVESCDRIDNDCDGAVDEASAAVLAAESVFDPQARPDDGAGESVAAIGDVDGDGVSDFAVGEPLYDGVTTNVGSVAVYSGGDRSPICRATDPAADSADQLGWSVAGIGDVSGDGVPDLAAGARLFDEVASNDGAVLLFSGADCALLERLVAVDGSNNDQLGSSVAGIGDVTGDGIPDIAAGAPFYDGSAGNDQGSVVIFSGADGSVVERVVMPNGRTGDDFGTAVAALDDIDGDGIAEILVGAPDDVLLSGGAGSVSVLSGGDRSYIRKLVDPLGSSGDDFGAAVAGLADVDGDGFPDIAVGAPGEDAAAANSGVVVILSGADGSVIRRLKDPAASGSDGLGISVAGASDMNGDGVPEIVAGAPLDDAGGTNAGTALLFSGADGSLLYELVDPAAAAGDGAGSSVAVAELSGDGVADVIVGAPGAASDEEDDVGKAIVFSVEADCDGDGATPFGGDCDDGDPDNFAGNTEVCDVQDNDCDIEVDDDDDLDGADLCADCDPDNTLIYPGAPERCNGVDDDCDGDVDEGDDLDGDGFETPCDCDDGATSINPGELDVCNHVDDDCDGIIDEGASFPEDSQRLLDTTPSPSLAFGTAIAEVGDVDGDGHADFLVGAPLDDTVAGNAGAVVVVSGVDRSTICRATDPAGSTSDQLGVSVAGIGDVTGDGTPDFAAGAPTVDAAETNEGAVVLFSGADCGFVRRLTAPDGGIDDQLGQSVARIGDVTGDGVPDVAAGAARYDGSAGTNQGAVVVFSGADGSLVYRAVLPGARTGDLLGASLAGIGDVTGDGIADLAVGASSDDLLSGSNAGSVTVLSGADGAFVYKAVDPLGGSSDGLGASVAPVADLDADGFPDFLAGSSGEDAVAANSGVVLAFSGFDGSVIRRYKDPAAASSDALGTSVSSMPDITGDGLPEVLVGVPLDDGLATNAGAALIFSGGDGILVRELQDPAGMAGDSFGEAVLGIAGLGAGGAPAVAVGAPDVDDQAVSNAGAVVVFGFDSDCDGDGFTPFAGDCDDADPNNWVSCATCVDADGDGAFVECDAYVTINGPDCDETDPTIFPGAPELCDGQDNDCDTVLPVVEIDDDSDGYVECTVDAGGWDGTPITDGDDCNDAEPTIFPTAPELCDGQDNDCDTVLPAVEIDDDADGYVDCTVDAGGWDGTPITDGDDCDDTDATVFPAAAELCDGQDNDCDTVLPTIEIDDDSDGYVECTIDAGGWDGTPITDGDDCDDAEPTIFPTAPELCDGQDNDCDTVLPSVEIDDDGDGYVDCTVDAGGWDGTPITDGDDCDDTDATIFPAAAELCDGQDNDCDTVLPTVEIDDDADGYVECTVDAGGWDGTPITDGDDCDDTDATIFPAAAELCDGQDNDCDTVLPTIEIDDDSDGYVDCTVDAGGWDGTPITDGDDCDDTDATIFPTAAELCDGQDNDCDTVLPAVEIDDDSDGYVECTVDAGGWDGTPITDGDDCDDTDATIFPAAAELCDGQDNDCDTVLPSVEIDDDSDGYVDCTVDPGGWDGTPITDGDDCDDTDATIFPAAAELCDGQDNDCDTALPSVEIDDDSDGYVECTVDAGGWDGTPITDGDDCDDTDATIFPTAAELCDGQDNDCDTVLPSVEIDDDSDGYVDCTVDAGGWDGTPITDGDDCDDTDATIFPTAAELCDGQDNDCDTVLPAVEIDDDADGYVDCTVDAGGWDGTPITDGDDCDDTDATIFPAAAELCDGQDNDCDTVLPSVEIDDDADGYVDCTVDAGGWDGTPITDGDDCDDADASNFPGNVEACDEQDNDCDTLIDEGFDTPGVVEGLLLTDSQTLVWSIEPTADRYDVVRGDLAALRGGAGDFASAIDTCLDDDGADTQTVDAGNPAGTGDGFFYLTRGQAACKTGSYDTGGAGQVAGRDAGASAAPTVCP